MQFSITNAAFEGLRVMKRAPLAVVMWGVAYLVCLAIIILLAGTAIVSAAVGMETGGYDSAAAARVMGAVGVAYVIAIPLFLIAASIVVAATCRAVLTPNKPGFFFMRLGGAEFRLMGAYLVIVLLAIVAIILFGLVFGVIAGGAFLASGGLQSGQASGPMLALFYPAYFGAIILYVWVSVRLSLLGPITVAEGRFALGRSWAATKGRFWVLIDLGAATMVRWFLVYFAAICIFCVVAMIGGGLLSPDAMAAAETGGAGQVMAKALPFIIIFSILMAGFIALQFTILSTPFAVFYRDVVAAKPAPELVEATEV